MRVFAYGDGWVLAVIGGGAGACAEEVEGQLSGYDPRGAGDGGASGDCVCVGRGQRDRM